MAIYRYQHGDRPLDGFTIKHGLGRGGFGEVYYAVSDSGREVALKSVQNYEDIELRGIKHCMNLKSAQLVSIFDIKHNEQGLPFVIMEYVDGPSLREIIDSHPQGLGSAKAAFFLKEMIKGIAYLHECGVVHRDLKPHNVFYEQGVVKIGDYSLSKAITTSHRSGHTVTVGTVHYMAPEISMGRYDHTVDIYALGVMLYEMVTGNPPFLGDSMGEVLMKHVAGKVNFTGIDEPFARVIAKAMQKEPTDRYQSAQAMIDDLMGHTDLHASVASMGPESLTVIAEKAVRDAAARKKEQYAPQPTTPYVRQPTSSSERLASFDEKIIDGVTGAVGRTKERIRRHARRINWNVVGLVLAWLVLGYVSLVLAVGSTVAQPPILRVLLIVLLVFVGKGFIRIGRSVWRELAAIFHGNEWGNHPWHRPQGETAHSPPPVPPATHAAFVHPTQPQSPVPPVEPVQPAKRSYACSSMPEFVQQGLHYVSRVAKPGPAYRNQADRNQADRNRPNENHPEEYPSEPTLAGSPFNRLFSLITCGLPFFGVPIAGLHRLYVGRIKSGVLWLCTFGLLGVGQIWDMVMISLGQFKDAKGNPVLNFTKEGAQAIVQPVNDFSAVTKRRWTESRIGFRLGNLIFNLLGGILLVAALGLGAMVAVDLPQAVAEGVLGNELAEDISRDTIHDWHVVARTVLSVATIVVGTLSCVCLIFARRESNWTHMLRLPVAAVAFVASVAVLGAVSAYGMLWHEVGIQVNDRMLAAAFSTILGHRFVPTTCISSLLFVFGVFILAWPAKYRAVEATAAVRGSESQEKATANHFV